MNCELLGLSIDSVFSHIAWTRNIAEKFGVEIPFPIIEDLKMEVAHAYGMIHEGASDTSAVRATFVIDPEGVLRAMLYYPMSNGRSIPRSFDWSPPCRRATRTVSPHRPGGSQAMTPSCRHPRQRWLLQGARAKASNTPIGISPPAHWRPDRIAWRVAAQPDVARALDPA